MEMDLTRARTRILNGWQLLKDVREHKIPSRQVDWYSVIPAFDEAIEFFLAHAPSGDPMRGIVEEFQEQLKAAEANRKS